MFRSCQIIIGLLCSLLKLYYSIHNYIPICKRGVVAASYDAHLATAPQHIPTQHDMLPQHLVCKYELNCEYCNIIFQGKKLHDDDLTRSKHVGVF